jgi:hypothetical protein
VGTSISRRHHQPAQARQRQTLADTTVKDLLLALGALALAITLAAGTILYYMH